MMNNWQRHIRAHPRTVGAVMALLLFAGSFPGSRLSGPNAPAPRLWWPGVLVAGISCVIMLWRRGRPLAVALLTAVCAVIVTALGYMPTVLLVGPLMLALYTLANSTNRKTANTVALTTVALLAGTAVIVHPHETIEITVIATAAVLLLPTALGTAARVRRAYVESVQARAEHAERTREEEARRRVAEERMRIARELHDVVAHHLALANAQAGTAAHLVDSHPAQARKILADLTGTTSSALRELKATVGVLREADDPDAPLEPAPGLARLPELTAALETAGLAVTVTTEGAQRPLSPGVDLTAYRIVQEALTNVTKHAATRTAHIRLAYSRDRLTIAVTDQGGDPADSIAVPSASTPGRGFGLIGMRERALSVGGRLQAGRRPEGGFNVTAELPLLPHDLEEDRTP